MSITVTSPAWVLPGAIHRPGLPAWKVAVACGAHRVRRRPRRSRRRRRWARRRRRPRRRGAARVDRLDRRPRPARGARPQKPVPRIASTIAAAPVQRAGARTAARGGAARQALEVGAGVAAQLVAGRRAAARRRRGRASRSSRATTRPSPPLLPLPHDDHDAARRAPARHHDVGQARAGALHQLERPGCPRSSIAQASMARCCSASGRGSSQLRQRGHGAAAARMRRRRSPPRRRRCGCG